MITGIEVNVLGDYGPFSRMGKCIGYKVTIGNSTYLVDCGLPLFQTVGGNGLKAIKGAIITHCHDDHKRWFTDLILFNKYATDIGFKVQLLTTEEINGEIFRASGTAIDRSFSANLKQGVIDIEYEDYIDHTIIGPKAKYKIVSKDMGNGHYCYLASDSEGNPLSPDMAKIIISKKTGRPRLLFKDPDYKEWVEPEVFYPFSSPVFYESDKNVYHDKEGFTIEAFKASVWHGIPGIGIKFKTAEETLIFSSYTVHNVKLWEQLYTEKKQQRHTLSKKEFESAAVIYGDINDYIERVWSEERFHAAMNDYSNGVVINDIAVRNSIVHTDYRLLENTVLKKERTILTHSPDQLVSEWVLCDTEKHYKIVKNEFYEVVDGRLHPCNADIYYKDIGKYYVGYKNPNGRYAVCEDSGILFLHGNTKHFSGKKIFSVDLYEDIGGKYYPALENDKVRYHKRPDGKIECIIYDKYCSSGAIVENMRGNLISIADDETHTADEIHCHG